MTHFEFEWKRRDRIQLYAQGWQPERQPKAVVCLVHGLGEHSGRYAHLADFLNQKGYILLTFDLRGHGKSTGRRGHSADYEVLLDDISLLIDEAAKRFPHLPRFLYGHSLGGNLVLTYMLRRRPKLVGVVVSGPALRTAFEPPAWKITAGKLLNNVLPAVLMFNELEREALSRDPGVVQAYEDDPLIHDRISARLAIDVLQSGLWALENAEDFPYSLLIMHGGDDRITSVEASREFAQLVEGDCVLKVWEGLYHEIHNEPERHEVFAYLLGWLDSHVSHEP